MTRAAANSNPPSAAGPSAATAALTPLQVFALALVHSVLIAAIYSPSPLWPLAFVVPVPLAMIALGARSMRSALLPLLAGQMLGWLWLFRWVIPVTAVGYPFLALYHAVHMVLVVWVLRRIARSPRFSRIPMTLLLPLVWIAMEYFRGDVAFNGYPWYMISNPLIEWLAFVQSSDLFGAYFVSFLAAIPAGVALDVLRFTPGLTKEDPGRFPRAARARSWSSFVRPGVIGALLLIANVAYGQWRLHQALTLEPGPRVLAIQTNLPQDNKTGWTQEQRAIDIPGFMQLTREAITAVGGRGAFDLVVWPETMVYSAGFEPSTRDNLRLFGEGGRSLTEWADAVEAFAHDELKSPMLVGSEAWLNTSIVAGDDGLARLIPEKEYNSAYLLQGQPPYPRSDKAVLTPFGETMPYISNWPWLEAQLLALGAGGMQFNLDANSEVGVLAMARPAPASTQPKAESTGQNWRIAAPICFEDTVAWLCRKMAFADGEKRADLFVNISNDGWFGTSKGDRILHAEIARFRCVENRLPMVRCVNTGVSVQIDSCGRLVAAAASGDSVGGGYGLINQSGWLLANVMLDSRVTLFSRIGNLLPTVCLLAAFALFLLTFVRRSGPATV